MCQTCMNEGGFRVDNGWFLEFVPCPDCDGRVTYERNIKALEERLKQSERGSA